MNTQKTRCPYCSSMFAVSDAQLSIRNGYTRCGKCFQVFKADDHLIADPAPIIESAAVPAVVTEALLSTQEPLAAEQQKNEIQPVIATITENDPITSTEEALDPIRLEATQAVTQEAVQETTPEGIQESVAENVELAVEALAIETAEQVTQPALIEKVQPETASASIVEDALIPETIMDDTSALSKDPITSPSPSHDISVAEIDALEAIFADTAHETASETQLSPQEEVAPVSVSAPASIATQIPETPAAVQTPATPAPTRAISEPLINDTPNEIIAEPQPVALAKVPETQPATPSNQTDDVAAIVPAMSHTFEQEFNDLWLSATTKAPAVESNELLEALTPESLLIHDSAIGHDLGELNISTDSVLHLGGVAAMANSPNSVIHDDDLVSYLNKNSVPSAPRNEYSAPDINILTSNKKKKTQLQTKPGNRVIERLSQPNYRFNVNFPAFFGRAFLSILMLALLAAQYIYFNFDRLAADPKYYSTMHRICASVGCNVPLVDISKIKMTEVLARRYPDSPNEATRFTALMTNHGNESQPYPALRLMILKDGKVLSGRILKPAEYLPNGYTALAKLPASAPTTVQFVLKIPRENIAVFALDPVQ